MAFALPAIPLSFHVIGVGFIMKSCRSLVMEADAPPSNMRGCESESKEFLHKLSLKCVDIMCMLQYPYLVAPLLFVVSCLPLAVLFSISFRTCINPHIQAHTKYIHQVIGACSDLISGWSFSYWNIRHVMCLFGILNAIYNNN